MTLLPTHDENDQPQEEEPQQQTIGYRIEELKQTLFMINATKGKMKGSEVKKKHHDESRMISPGYSRSLVMVVKTPQYWLFEIDEQVKQVSCGDSIVLVGSSGRTLYYWRFISDSGQLYKIVFDDRIDVVGFRRFLIVKTSNGDVFMSCSDDQSSYSLKKLETLPFDKTQEKVVEISCGSTHNLMLTDKGNVYAYGQNYGQLGINSTTYNSENWIASSTSHIPDKIKRIYCTYNTSFLLTEKGHLYGCGDHSYGANGLKTNTDSFKWTLVPNLENEIVTDLRTGLFFVAVLTQSHRVYVFGYFNFKQFGISPNFVYEVNRGPILMDSFDDMNNIQDIVCGGYNSAIITKSNHIFIGGDTSLVNSTGAYQQFNWNELVPQVDMNNSVLKIGLTGDRLVISIHQNDISKYFNFRNAWKIPDVFFLFDD